MKAFRIAYKVMIPITFLIIAISEGKAYWLAGIMLVFTLFYYGIQKFGMMDDTDKIKI
jgi:hypothetical protein